ncbi:hypothetical protein DPEC_G00111790 [Dallia pectoralis]|uniref:Uncharacterized protein n=1 Tax=Dallia pectoralis TaxID=75939 RepID=A0ACC2GTX5_DALPE|nr:hypothetical protein DPEC_G00111790 [Dallia pectoralis]
MRRQLERLKTVKTMNAAKARLQVYEQEFDSDEEISELLHSKRSLANSVCRESLQLETTLRTLGRQYQRELARVCGAQLKVKSALDRLGGRLGGTAHARRSTAVHATTGPAKLGLLHMSGPLPPKL